MNQLDVYYRALSEYRHLTNQSRECVAFKKATAQANQDDDKIMIKTAKCTVDNDWVEEIEKGLIFIEKAIKEERQFIYSNGEVLPIERVKHVSKDSVQHLARHSNLITREQDEDNIVPDKLYSAERLNDYAVYENRFLYMLLCYLKDFVMIRYSKILSNVNKYDGRLMINKEIVLPKRTVSYTVDLHDIIDDDTYLREHNSARDIIDRIDLILKTILAFLATPLMEYASKAPLIKPPITKTNVLRMDHNFKGAVALYDYIISYDKEGFSIEIEETNISPFGDVMADELSEACGLLSFLMYEYGLDIKSVLKKNYEIEELRRQSEEMQKKNNQLEQLKRKLAKSEIPVEEYLLALEKQIKALQNDNMRIDPLLSEIAEQKEIQSKLEFELSQTKGELQDVLNNVDNIKNECANKVAEVEAECEKTVQENIDACNQELLEQENKFNLHISQLNSELRDAKISFKNEKEQMNQNLQQLNASLEESVRCREELEEKNRVLEARIKSLLIMQKSIPDGEDYGEKEQFDELEKEFTAFYKFYCKQWGSTKKKIRKSILNIENLKG
jgi:hypothetical protein